MSLFRTKERIMTEIVDTSRMLEMIEDHPFMSIGIKAKLQSLEKELKDLPETEFEPRIKLLFSGRAVKGSIGIKSSFVGKAVNPFQEIVKTQAAMVRFGGVARRGQAKNSPNSELFLTSLPSGSFGVELCQLDSNDLFAEHDVAVAMKQVIELIVDIAASDESFEIKVEKIPNRQLTNLRKFLKEVSDEHSILKMESGEVGVEISEEAVAMAYLRVASTLEEEVEEVIEGTLRGILLDSGRFEVQTLNGISITGYISPDLSENILIEYDRAFLNQTCQVHVRIHKTTFKSGKVNTDYELLEIKEYNQ